MILLISASQLARITGVSHWLNSSFFEVAKILHVSVYICQPKTVYLIVNELQKFCDYKESYSARKIQHTYLIPKSLSFYINNTTFLV
jgi:hypothetical protein